MGLILDVGYATGALILSPFLLFKFATDKNYRRGFGERLGGVPKRVGDRPSLWLHCSSVGEVTLSRSLIKELTARIPNLDLRVSTMTPAGREHAKTLYPDSAVHFYPLDFTFAVRRALRRARPHAVVLVELEVWPNFIQVAKGRKIPVGIVNGRMSHRSHRRYRRFIWYFRSIFRRLDRVGVQHATYGERIAEFGLAGKITVTGNLKFDAAIAFDPKAVDLEVRVRFGLGDDPLLVAGSTHDPEEKLIVDAYQKLKATFPKLRLLIAPRHIERAPEIQKAIELSGLKAARRSQQAAIPGDHVILLDTVGELAKVYAAASVVYIGGTFCERGGQNMLEPAVLGRAVISGPSLENFRDIADALSKAGGMTILQTPDQIAPAVEKLLKDPALAADMGVKAQSVVESGRGALKATADLVCGLLRPE